jgi:hypothetical protein
MNPQNQPPNHENKSGNQGNNGPNALDVAYGLNIIESPAMPKA